MCPVLNARSAKIFIFRSIEREKIGHQWATLLQRHGSLFTQIEADECFIPLVKGNGDGELFAGRPPVLYGTGTAEKVLLCPPVPILCKNLKRRRMGPHEGLLDDMFFFPFLISHVMSPTSGRPRTLPPLSKSVTAAM